MIDPLIQLMRFTRDLLGHDESLIKKGRLNEAQALDTTPYIAVDAIAPATPITRGDAYDGVAEVMTYHTEYRMPATLDFYGTNAHANASKFAVLVNSHASQSLQKRYTLRVGATSGVTDIKALTGQKYVNRVQVAVTLRYTQHVDVNVLRIDSAPIEVISNEQ